MEFHENTTLVGLEGRCGASGDRDNKSWKQSPKHFHAEEHHANHIHHLSDEQVKHNVSYYEDVRRNHLHSSKNHEDTVAGGWMEVLQNGLKIPKDHDAIEALRITHQRQRVNPYGRKSKKIHQGSPSLPFYENTAMVAKAPPMPPDFIDSHRVQKQSVQEQLLAKHVASQQDWQPWVGSERAAAMQN